MAKNAAEIWPERHRGHPGKNSIQEIWRMLQGRKGHQRENVLQERLHQQQAGLVRVVPQQNQNGSVLRFSTGQLNQNLVHSTPVLVPFLFFLVRPYFFLTSTNQ